jgi:hypothetical protein
VYDRGRWRYARYVDPTATQRRGQVRLNYRRDRVRYRTLGPSTYADDEASSSDAAAVGSVRRDEIGSRPLQRVLRTGTPILEHRGDPGAVVLLEQHQLRSKPYVTAPSSRARSRSRISSLSWSIAPNAEGLAAGSGSDELPSSSSSIPAYIPLRLGSRRGWARRRTDRAAHIACRQDGGLQSDLTKQLDRARGLMARAAERMYEQIGVAFDDDDTRHTVRRQKHAAG